MDKPINIKEEAKQNVKGFLQREIANMETGIFYHNKRNPCKEIFIEAIQYINKLQKTLEKLD